MITYSVLTPTHNRCDTYLPDCMASVQAQIGEGFAYEHILIDDCSKDETAGYLQDAAAGLKNVLTLRTPHNGGPAAALNLGLEHATGNYILPLDDDDVLLTRSLALHTHFLEQVLPEPRDLVFGLALLIDAEGRHILDPALDFNDIDYSEDPDLFYRHMLRNNQLVNSAVVIRRAAALAVHGWATDVSSQDWEMGLKLLNNGATYALNPAYLSGYRVHAEQLSAIHATDGTWERDGELLRARYGRTR